MLSRDNVVRVRLQFTGFISCHSDPSLILASGSVPAKAESTWTGWAKEAMNDGRLSLGCAVNSSTVDVACSRGWLEEPGTETVVEAMRLSNWRSESMKRQVRTEVMLRPTIIFHEMKQEAEVTYGS